MADDQYAQNVIKEYTHWTLYLSEDQRYLGRAIAWLRREGGMQRFSEITDEEMAELRVLMKEYEGALQTLWHPDFMNYCWLANLISEHGGHGHMHLIPRYKDARAFSGVQFVDGRWGQNYTPNDEFKPAQDVFFQIRDALKKELT